MTLDWHALISALLPHLPAFIAQDITTLFTFLVAGCAVVARYWPRPSDGSKWLWLYTVINSLAMNGKHATNANSLNKDP